MGYAFHPTGSVPDKIMRHQQGVSSYRFPKKCSSVSVPHGNASIKGGTYESFFLGPL